ncbi:MAG: thrombospondin type 3 repeat-containing protein [Oleispira sp.]
MLSIKALRSLWLFISLGLSTLFLPNTSFAALIDVQQKNDIVYFLFAAPNKIVRYDLNSNAFLSQFSLTDVPTAFHVNSNYIYTGYNKTLKRTDLEGLNTSDIYQVSSEISKIASINNSLFMINSPSKSTLISTIDHSFIKEIYNYNLTMLASSQSQNSYYYRGQNNYSNGLIKFSPGQNGESSKFINSNYQSRNETTDKLFTNTSGNKVYANSGYIFSAEKLNFIGSLGGRFDHINFTDGKPVVLRGNELSLYDVNNHNLGNLTLNYTPSHIAAKSSLITTFITNNSLVEAHQIDIARLTLATPIQPANPKNINYVSEKIISDAENMLFLLDSSSLAIHRRKITEESYAGSWGLLLKPSWMTYSNSHKRLYLGYDSGRITYFDTSQGDSATETQFITLTTPIKGLLAAGDYVYAVDHASSYYIHYGIDIAGDIINSISNNSFSNTYLWGDNQGKIHYWYHNKFKSITVSDIDGTIKFDSDDARNDDLLSSPILHLNPNGQLLLNGLGQIIGAQSHTVLNNLSNPISDAVWVKDQLITTLKDTSIIQFWQEDYILFSQHQINNTNGVRLFSLDEKLLIISQTDSGPMFNIYDLDNIPDTDNDSINDFNDNCINIKNLAQDDSDNDYIGNLCDPDNDNDLIPDSIENLSGLDPFDASDVNLDLDGDGFSNLIEYYNQTNINDINSKPETIFNLSYNFNDDIPLGFYQFNTTNIWMNKKIDNNNVLSSGLAVNKLNPSSIFYTADFINGLLSFDHKIHGDIYYRHNVEVYLDGIALDNIYSSSSWKHNTISIEAGIHSLEFRFSYLNNGDNLNDTYFLIDNFYFAIDSDSDGHSDIEDNCPEVENKNQWDSDDDGLGNECDNDPYGQDRDQDGFGDNNDNCPDTYNPDQSNVDEDYYGDACDGTDDRPVDTDQDGVPNDRDNCPNTANSDQHDFDHDRIGDLCDIDIDNDGLSNAQENQFDFLSSYNKEDALLDFDNDGASNEYEINHGTQPTESDTFTVINLADYYPLGNIDYFYVTDNQFIRVSVKPSNKPAQFIMQYSNGTEWLVERRASGIYLLSYNNNDDSLLIFSNMVIFPGSMSPGQITNITSNVHREGESEIEEFSNQLYLKDVGETAWQGKIYPSITLVENGNATIYLKGVGPMNRNGLELDSLNLDTLASPEITAPEKSNKSGGHFNLAFLLGLLLLATIKARNNRSH